MISLPFHTFASAAVRVAVLACTICMLTGCSNFTRSLSGDNTGSVVTPTKFLKDGSITVARPFPSVLSGDALGQVELKAFLPVISYQGAWIQVNKERGVVILMNGDTEAESFPADGVGSVPAGDYTVVHKQRNPLWYATDTYFSKRQLPVPPEGDRGRFRRGALGNFALFLTKDLPIHCGPLWSDEIGGIKLPETEMSRLYYLINLGAPIKVQ